MPECPNWQLMGADQCLAQDYQGCPNCPWTRQDDLKDAMSCNELLVWVWDSLGLTGRWTGGGHGHDAKFNSTRSDWG